jgi:polyisoprenoid-binding protein YceI
LLAGSYFATAQTFIIDNNHTAVTTKVMRFDVVNVVARFNSVSGTVNYDAADPSKITATITVQAESYSANNIEGEKAIKSVAFLDVKNHPEIKLTTKLMTKAGAGYKVVANLTLHGVTHEISFPVTITGPIKDLVTQKQSIGISGVFTINRQDYGMIMAGKMPSGAPIVGNEVEISINALAAAQ